MATDRSTPRSRSDRTCPTNNVPRPGMRAAPSGSRSSSASRARASPRCSPRCARRTRPSGGACTGSRSRARRPTSSCARRGSSRRTIASWQLALASGRAEVEAGDVYVIDEAGMVDNRQMLAVLEAIERGGAKLDPRRRRRAAAGDSRRVPVPGSRASGGVGRDRHDPAAAGALAARGDRPLARGDAAAAVAAYARPATCTRGSARRSSIGSSRTTSTRGTRRRRSLRTGPRTSRR